MADTLERVKKIIVDRLGVDESKITLEASSKKTWALTPWM